MSRHFEENEALVDTTDQPNSPAFDVIVVGGGPSGLMASVAASGSRRKGTSAG